MINLYNIYLSINLSIFPSVLLFTSYLYLELVPDCLNNLVGIQIQSQEVGNWNVYMCFLNRFQ